MGQSFSLMGWEPSAHLSFQHHWLQLWCCSWSPFHSAPGQLLEAKGLDLPLLLIPVPDRAFPNGRARFGQTDTGAQPSPVPGWQCRGQWYLQRDLQGWGSQFPPCVTVPFLHPCKILQMCTHGVACSWTGSGVQQGAQGLLSRGGEHCPSLNCHNQRSQQAMTGSGEQLQPSACIFLGSQGLGRSVPGHRALGKATLADKDGQQLLPEQVRCQRGVR